MNLELILLAIRQFFGTAPKIKAAKTEDKAPWSITVVNSNRAKRKAAKRKSLMILVGLGIFSCVCCGGSFFAYTSANPPSAPKQAKAAAVPASLPATARPPDPTLAATQAPRPTATPAPPTIEPVVATVFIDPMGGPPGATVQLSISAFNSPSAAVIVWWDNAPVVRGQIGDGGMAVLRFDVPADAPPGQHSIIVDVTDRGAIKSITVKFEVQNR